MPLTEYANWLRTGPYGVANTPDPGNPISKLDIKNVFGNGLGLNPGTNFNDYHGIEYWETFYPYRKNKFNTTLDSELTIEDFYSKSSIDPVVPGRYEDFDAGGPRTVQIPPFRRKVRLEIWGAGGGGGAGDHDRVPATASSGGTSSFTYSSGSSNYTVTATGGGGGGGGYRYGNQNGGGGGGGTVSNTAGLIGTFTKINGSSGAGGNAGGGRGGTGGSSPAGSYALSGISSYGAGGAGGYLRTGYPGNAPGGGGGGGGSSDFQSGKNANPNRAAGGGGGSGAYARIEFVKGQINGGSQVSYTVGSGGNFATGNMYNGAKGANGGFKMSWDYEPAILSTQILLVDLWNANFNGCAAGWNDLTLAVGTSQFSYAGKTTGVNGGIILAVTGAKADSKLVGRMSDTGHTNVTDNYFYNSILFFDGNPLYTDTYSLSLRNFTSGWKTMYNFNKDNMVFKIESVFDGTALKISVYGDCKGGTNGGPLVNTVLPTLTYP